MADGSDFAPTQTFAGPIWSGPAERSVIGAALYDASRFPDLFEQLQPGSFYDPVHVRIWKVLSALFAAGSAIEPALVAHRVGTDEAFLDWGGRDGLADLVETCDLRAARDHIDVVADLATRRAIAALGRDVASRARDTADGSADEILADMERGAAAISQGSNIKSAWISAGDMLAAAIHEAKNRSGLIRYPVGIASVDAKLGGLNPGETTVVAAWTGMGKTIAGLQIAKGCASQRLGVAYFSLEMAETPMAMRMACDVAYDRSAAAYSGLTTNITIDRAIRGNLQPNEWGRLEEAHAIIDAWPIHFDMRPNLSIAQIQAATIRLHREWARHGIKPGPVIIDHIGKVKPSTDRKGSVTAETRDVANDIDIMAKRLGVPVVALSQLNRVVEQGASKDKRPSLSSIKDSGAVAENARQVIFIYRPEYYYREPFEHEDHIEKADRLTELAKVQNHFYWLIDKNSNGPRAQVLSYCKADCSAVREWDPA